MSALGYSQRLIYLPISLFGISVAAASLPAMSRDATAHRLRPRLVNGFFQILFYVLPTAVFFILFGDLVIRVVYQRNEFTEVSTILVATVLGTYALGLVASSSLKLFASGFHALQDTRTPMKLAAVSVAVGIAAAVALTLTARSRLPDLYRAYAAAGIALGGAVGAWLNLLLLWGALSRRLDGLFAGDAVYRTARIGLAAVAAGGAGWLARRWLETQLTGDGFTTGLALLLGIALAGAIPYFLIARRPPRIAEERPGDAG